jgi:peptidoglycan/LPS O-acetylase OafA/YrhL
VDALNDIGLTEPANTVPIVLPSGHARTSAVEYLQPSTQLVAEVFESAACDQQQTPDATTRRSSKGLPEKPKDVRYASLDVIRGMACLMLLVYHSAFYADHSWSSSKPETWTFAGLAINVIGRLWIGVPMFFVVSGYCIAASIDSLRRKPQSLTQYFWRRMRRIYPPLWGALVFAIIFTSLIELNSKLFASCLQLPRMAEFIPIDWISNFTATSSWLSGLLGEKGEYLIQNTWTLCYEEQFYAVTGLLLVVAARHFFATVYAVALATLVVRHVSRHFHWPIDGFFFDGHWLIFAAGILLYHRIQYLRGQRSRWTIAALAGVAGYGLCERLFAADAHHRHVGEYIFVACLFALVMIVAKKWDSHIVRSFAAKPFLWCGKFSYSIYLTHYPIVVTTSCVLAGLGFHTDGWVFLVTVPACIAISLPVAYLFYLLVERHFVNAPAR